MKVRIRQAIGNVAIAHKSGILGVRQLFYAKGLGSEQDTRTRLAIRLIDNDLTLTLAHYGQEISDSVPKHVEDCSDKCQ